MSAFITGTGPEYEAKSVPGVSGRRLLLAALTCVTALIGLAPVTTYFGRTTYLIAFAAGGGLIALLKAGKGGQQTDGHRRGVLHYAAAVTVSICLWGMLGLMWFGLYYLVFWLFQLIDNFIVSVDARAWGFYVSAFLSAPSALGVATLSVKQMTQLLDAEGLNRVRGWKHVLCLVLPVLVTALMAGALWALRGTKESSIYLLLQFVPYIMGLPALTLEQSLGRRGDMVEAVSRLMEAAGYHVIRSPRSEDSLIDPVLSRLDLVAYDDSQFLAAKLKTRAESALPVGSGAAASLSTSVKALEYSYYEQWLDSAGAGPELHRRRVRPLLILIDREPDESFVSFCVKEDVPVLKLDGRLLERVESMEREKLRETARELLGGLAPADAGVARVKLS